MRAGHAFSVSLEMIHREFQEPLAGEFRRTFEEHNLGLPLDVALQKLAKRVPSLDVHFFVSAVLLQKRTGGNLAEILDKLAYVIRERFKLRGRITRHQRAWADDGHRAQLHSHRRRGAHVLHQPGLRAGSSSSTTSAISCWAARWPCRSVGYLIMKQITKIEV